MNWIGLNCFETNTWISAILCFFWSTSRIERFQVWSILTHISHSRSLHLNLFVDGYYCFHSCRLLSWRSFKSKEVLILFNIVLFECMIELKNIISSHHCNNGIFNWCCLLDYFLSRMSVYLLVNADDSSSFDFDLNVDAVDVDCVVDVGFSISSMDNRFWFGCWQWWCCCCYCCWCWLGRLCLQSQLNGPLLCW